MQTIDCILTTLLVLGALWCIKRAYKFLWLDRVPREDYENAERYRVINDERASRNRDQAYKLEREIRDARDSIERLEKMIVTQSDKIFQVRKVCVPGKMLATFDSIMGGGPKV